LGELKGILINILSFNHPHAASLFSEGLWGFPDRSVNRPRWVHIEIGDPVLIFGELEGKRGVWFSGEIIEKFEEHKPVKYWIQNPTGYPLQIRIRFKFPSEKLSSDTLSKVRIIGREELASVFGIKIFRAKTDRWSLLVFKDVKEKGITYEYEQFKALLDEFHTRNKVITVVEKPEHDKVKELIYQIGVIQKRNPDMEYQIDGRRLDVVWKRTSKSVPSVAFEIQFGGNIFEALTKLKHAYDLWNTIPVLITTEPQIEGAKQWLEGSFHELKDVFRIIEWNEITKYYKLKQETKNLEVNLGIP
jgi:hypothetical protein